MDLDHPFDTPHLFQHPLITEIGKVHGSSATGFAKMVDSIRDVVIPKRDALQMLLENLEANVFELTKEGQEDQRNELLIV